MVGIVIVSHSEKIAEGVKELALQMAEEVPMAAAGGTSDGRVGTDIEKISNAIKEVYSEDGVIILFDLGSSFMNAEMAIDFLPDNMKEKVEIVDAALVEGVITAGVESSINKTLEDIKKSLKSISINKMS
ncbi:PTS-dependent dihydroxyacetone kinase phosphotransferase subunit DhaM [Clostridium sp. P21]|uniref:phosphoenolpyruvate--glycerone phosphotransferase n=1 Tax=Clostridium muellerianum TaxID=2716538 RepID=A0A7Y0HP45_9CLOT|nr:dihydroxyacetone kinase phosphoryl donor subunit DhaM [Clostridium muellerianum]NMM62671.1 PTS-dependent dihydroxyacetone kinase phosphotransferase subunit DhaM [Clostridium muellerianum]